MLSDIEIAQRAKMKDINEIAEMIVLTPGELSLTVIIRLRFQMKLLRHLKIKMTENLFW